MNNYFNFNRFIIIVATILSIITCNAYSSDDIRDKALAGFIEHIHGNVTTSRSGSNLCIFGSDGIALRLKGNISKNFIDLGEDIDPVKDYKDCKVVYIARSKEKEVKYSVNFFNDKGVLTIAVFSSFIADGGMMSVEIGRRNFELSVNDIALKEFGIRIDSSIAALIVELIN